MIAGLTGCGTKKSAEKTTEINVGYFNNVTHAQALYMKAQGTLDKAFDGKAAVKWTSFNAGPSEVEALFSGNIDIGYIGPVPAISANVKSKGDVSLISGASQAGAELVKAPGSDIKSAKDLDGKTVAIPQIGNTQHLCLLKLLSDNGLKTVEEGGTVTVTAVENADVQNMGEQDFIVTYEEAKTAGGVVHFLKAAAVVVTSFIGAAFSIMTFNNDVDTTKLFGQIYELITGSASDGFTILELTYSVGLTIGILIFFNHFGKRKFTVDPTPMEVEMRLYENDIQTTLIEDFARKEKEMDVDK